MGRSVLGIECGDPPQIFEILFGVNPVLNSDGRFALSQFRTYLFSFMLNPSSTGDKYDRFFNGKLFFLLFVYIVVFKLSREMAHMVAQVLDINRTLLLIAHIAIVTQMMRTYGYECTVILVVLLYCFYAGVVMLLPSVAQSEIAEVIPVVKELPGATAAPGINHCRRLAVCRESSIYDNHRMQVGKYEKCLQCAAQNEQITFDESLPGCESTRRDVSAQDCYKCTEDAPPPSANCSSSDPACKLLRTVLDSIDSDGIYDRESACNESGGSMCYFAHKTNQTFLGWPKGVTFRKNDPASKGKGFPTKEICEHHHGTSCVRFECQQPEEGPADGLSAHQAECACQQYKDVPQFDDPCARLASKCDERSVAYAEAKLMIKQMQIETSDIVTSDHLESFLSRVDELAENVA